MPKHDVPNFCNQKRNIEQILQVGTSFFTIRSSPLGKKRIRIAGSTEDKNPRLESSKLEHHFSLYAQVLLRKKTRIRIAGRKSKTGVYPDVQDRTDVINCEGKDYSV
ncbi:hypothetical protein CEXT_490451 [Caerostris extrusa]|uniref:Uncharacterized protein n=1 Tax=Caerostris extrusa TaxID=172846 RepID=A0AAV4XY73_CAEEX|nr:hypothetical protein CEXT_490451 [Caerostris extrusa]